MAFAAIDKRIERNIPSAREEWASGKKYVQWGDRNLFPDYLLSLYHTVTTLRGVVDGAVNYTVGDEVTTAVLGGKMNKSGENVRELVRKIAFDYWVFGGFALQVIRNNAGDVAELYHMPINFLRWDKETERFFYSEEWDKYRFRMTERPRFVRDFTNNADTVLVRRSSHIGVYPEPCYIASIKACEVERHIDDYHLNSIENGFLGSYIFQFNNGQPSDDMKREIEKNVQEKFSGSANAGRIMMLFNDNEETGMKIEKVEQPDFADRYNSLASHCRQQIFSSFHANPNLFGIPTESLGFNNEEYEASFKLFNRTMIQPVQDMIVDAFDTIFGVKGSVQIKPFSLDRATEIVE